MEKKNQGKLYRLKAHEDVKLNSFYRELLSKMSIDYHPLAYSHMRNPNVSTEILGNISQGISHQDENQGALYAVGEFMAIQFVLSCLLVFCLLSILLATLDGTLMMVRDEQILW